MWTCVYPEFQLVEPAAQVLVPAPATENCKPSLPMNRNDADCATFCRRRGDCLGGTDAADSDRLARLYRCVLDARRSRRVDDSAGALIIKPIDLRAPPRGH